MLGCRKPLEGLLPLSLGPRDTFISLGGQGSRTFSLALVANQTICNPPKLS